ncbi:hypothetical protein DVH24_021077 [Malus domestica]|uniref:DUF1985 domain-containing protein n=1 Tax=Malus domestica TaxID=3750 RepID=A0A498JDD3_MALDO|nr:hypothetical protein DVH24_021077 [Malus domestica]
MGKDNVIVNLDYLDLMEDIDRFNNFAWGSTFFKQHYDNLSFAVSRRGRGRVERDSEGDEDKEKEEVRGTKRAQRSRWGYIQLAHEKEISDMNLVKKVEELSNVVEELRRVVMEKHVDENTEEEDEGKKRCGRRS